MHYPTFKPLLQKVACEQIPKFIHVLVFKKKQQTFIIWLRQNKNTKSCCSQELSAEVCALHILCHFFIFNIGGVVHLQLFLTDPYICFLRPSLSACFMICQQLDGAADNKSNLLLSCSSFVFNLPGPKMDINLSTYCLLVLGRSHVKPAAKRRCMKNPFPS